MSRRTTGRCWRRAHQRRRRPLPGRQNLPHEFDHIRADHEHRFPDYAHYSICRGQAEIEAESIAYLVTAHAGVDGDDYSVPYLASWAGGDGSPLRETASTAIRIARTIFGTSSDSAGRGDRLALGSAATPTVGAATDATLSSLREL